MNYVYLLCDATNAVCGVETADCETYDAARIRATEILRQGVAAVEVWQDARLVGRVDDTGRPAVRT